ncbi:MAG: penicillin acylase family protein, partial [Coriobacteriia bacterium]|nr:penicillin acylase family protein [Coriobacteriia bacterium]
IEAFERVERERAEPGTFPLLSELASSPRFTNSQAWVTLLRSWEEEAGFDTLTGVTFADLGLTVDKRETVASRATLLFHAWLVRVIDGVFADEMDALGLGLQGLAAVSEGLPLRSLLYLIERSPSFLGTFDEDLQDSLLWDDLRTERLECRDDRLVTAWLDAVDWLEYFLGDDRDRWRWGYSHTVRFSAADPSMDVLAIPSSSDAVFRRGFPRPGGLFTVDTGAFDLVQSSAQAPRFEFSEGAALRFAMHFAGSGPEATVALAGGQVADPLRANFRDGAEYWRHNTSHGLIYRLDEVVAQARTREVAWSSKHEGTD